MTVEELVQVMRQARRFLFLAKKNSYPPYLAVEHLLCAVEELSKAALPTTAPATPTAGTPAGQWGVGTNVCRKCGQRKEMLQDESTCQDCMTPTTPPSSPLDQADTENGRAERSCGCARWTGWRIADGWDGPWSSIMTLPMYCKGCGALKWFVLTPVPAAGPTSLTLAKPDSRLSVENSVVGSAESPLKGSTDER
jgi:hypothetical protein